MDRTKETLAWLRTFAALFVVLDASVLGWSVQHYDSTTDARLGAAIVVALILSTGLIWMLVVAARLLHRLGDTP